MTYDHNFFDGADTRHPRARFGEPVHVYNNYCRNASIPTVVPAGAGVGKIG